MTKTEACKKDKSRAAHTSSIYGDLLKDLNDLQKNEVFYVLFFFLKSEPNELKYLEDRQSI